MYQRPYIAALWLSLVSMIGIIGQMVVEGVANTLFLCLAVVPIVLALARVRWRR